MKPLKAGLAYFAIVFGMGFVLGAVRVTLVVPQLGARLAELLEMPLMLAVTVLAARFIVRRFGLTPALHSAVATGAFSLALVFVAEVSVFVGLQKKSPAEFLDGRDPVSFSVFLAMLLLFAAMPWLISRRN